MLSLYFFSLKLPSKKSIIVQNSRDANLVSSLLHDSSPIELIRGSGVNVKNFSPLPLPSYPPVLVFISRLLYTKGIHEYVQAAALIVKRFPGSKFLIAGTPDVANPSAVSHSYIESISKLPYISYLGHCSDIYQLISSAHILVLPSYYPEGLPKVLCEAAACARTVVTSNLPGCIDAIDDGKTGLAITPRDPILLASTIIELLSNPDTLSCMSQASRKRAETLFDIDEIVARHLQIYSSFLIQ